MAAELIVVFSYLLRILFSGSSTHPALPPVRGYALLPFLFDPVRSLLVSNCVLRVEPTSRAFIRPSTQRFTLALAREFRSPKLQFHHGQRFRPDRQAAGRHRQDHRRLRAAEKIWCPELPRPLPLSQREVAVFFRPRDAPVLPLFRLRTIGRCLQLS